MIRNWIGLHRTSTWMGVGCIIITSSVAHGLFGYLMAALNAALILLTIQVARYEGGMHRINFKVLVGAFILIAAIAFMMLKINWLAL